MTHRILTLGDTAFTVEFAAGFDDAARSATARLDAAIARERAVGALPSIVDVVPTFRSLTVHFEPAITPRAALEPQIAALAGEGEGGSPDGGAQWRFPVSYGGDAGPDLCDLAAHAGLTETQVIDLHAATEVSVHMLGFLPGFAFMGDIAPSLRRPRRAEPRTRVPWGSVAVADRLTAIYPWESPGGWHLIGHCPVPLFDASRAAPALLSPADRVAFVPTPEAEVAALAAGFAAGELAPTSFRVDD
ncbi:MAG: 5-oxoprolinase subunit PxpB [Pseudomonadota bacterium]